MGVEATAQMAMKSLVDEIAKKTSGSQGDPLSRDEVEKVVTATVKELRDNPDTRTALMAHGLPSSPEVPPTIPAPK